MTQVNLARMGQEGAQGRHMERTLRLLPDGSRGSLRRGRRMRHAARRKQRQTVYSPVPKQRAQVLRQGKFEPVDDTSTLI